VISFCGNASNIILSNSHFISIIDMSHLVEATRKRQRLLISYNIIRKSILKKSRFLVLRSVVSD
jgi:hypothetical protein